jgi:hypothetical protein
MTRRPTPPWTIGEAPAACDHNIARKGNCRSAVVVEILPLGAGLRREFLAEIRAEKLNSSFPPLSKML